MHLVHRRSDGRGRDAEADGLDDNAEGGRRGASTVAAARKRSDLRGVLRVRAGPSSWLVARLAAIIVVISMAFLMAAVRSGQKAASINGPLDTRDFAATIESCAGSERCLADAIAAISIHDAVRDGDICNRLIVGTHHKTGTVLAKRLFKALCSVEDLPEGHRLNHVKARDYVPGRPFVHFMRDPLEIVVSAYQYHLKTTEEWAVASGYQERLRNASLGDGLEMEYERSMYDAVEEEATVYRYTTQQRRSQDVFTIRESDMAEKEAFRFTVLALQTWLGMPLRPDPLEACCFIPKDQRHRGSEQHVSNASEKDELRRIVMSRHAGEIVKLRREMDFPQTGLEPEGDWDHSANRFGPKRIRIGASMAKNNDKRYWSCPPAKSHCAA